jgi:histone-lysine N-methyltransferase SETD3
MIVSSRIFGIKVNNKKTDCLVPLADMLNHKRPRHTIWFYSDKHNSFMIQALEDIEENQEVFDSYGKKCNSRFLLNYGFVCENNESN